MSQRNRLVIDSLMYSSLIFCPLSFARADGGAVRLRERAGNYQITVFTSPTPIRAGTVDISVLVQDATTGEWVSSAQVTLLLTARGSDRKLEFRATAEAATNKLLKAAVFRLPEPGRWEVVVDVTAARGPACARFEIDASEPLPRWLEMWPWFTWPAVVVVLFGMHQVFVRRKVR